MSKEYVRLNLAGRPMVYEILSPDGNSFYVEHKGFKFKISKENKSFDLKFLTAEELSVDKL